MIKANELRIGSLVYDTDKDITREIIEIDRTHVYFFGGGACRFELLPPIPITEELLIKLGFKEKHQQFELNGFQIDGIVVHFSFDKWRSDYDVESCDFTEIPVEIKYVHQLQNLYHALTGEELTLKQ